jgi:hypothetical protein
MPLVLLPRHAPPRFAPRAPRDAKESYAALPEMPPRAGKGQGRPPARLAPNTSRLDQPSSLPQRDGRVDMEQYSKLSEYGCYGLTTL